VNLRCALSHREEVVLVLVVLVVERSEPPLCLVLVVLALVFLVLVVLALAFLVLVVLVVERS
jgi:hypothetical protein